MTDTAESPELLNEQILRILVRFFRTGDQMSVTGGQLRLSDDLEYLRIQWAISGHIETLAQYLIERRHETQASLETAFREGSAIVHGRIDSVRTIRRRRLTGDQTQLSCFEPRRNFLTGPNQLLSWVIGFSYHIVRKYRQILAGSPEYTQRLGRLSRILDAARQIKGIGQAINNTNIRRRPSIKAVIQAGKSRKRLYLLAFDAFQVLKRIEAGNSDETINLLDRSLVGPLDNWQKFELLLALRMSEAISQKSGHDLVLRPIEPGRGRPIASIGPFDTYWQSRTEYAHFPAPESSDLLIRDVLQSYGVSVGADRPDIVICDRVRRAVVAIGEAKYSTSAVAAWKDSFREAIAQLVRYSRLYTDNTPQDVLLRRSIVAVSNFPDEMRGHAAPGTAPIAVGIADLVANNEKMSQWADRACF